MDDRDAGSIALVVLAGGGLAMLIALVLLVTIADLVISRGQAQLAADAAALAAMGEAVHAGWPPADVVGQGHPAGADTAAALAKANGGEVLECCGDDPSRREVVVAVPPRSALLRSVLPHVRARAAATLESAGASVAADGALATLPGAVGAAPDGTPGGVPDAAGARMWPVDGLVTSGFGSRVHPLTGQRRLHAGLDVAAAAGTPIRAAAAGQVVSATTLGGYGLTVDIRHGDGAVTRYAHQSRLLVRTGQQVAAGQVIGLVGSTGASTGPHLHFEVRVGGGPVDPLSWLPPQ